MPSWLIVCFKDLQRNRRYTTQKEMITAECTRNIEMAKNQFEQQSAGSACAGRVHEPWVGLQAFVDVAPRL